MSSYESAIRIRNTSLAIAGIIILSMTRPVFHQTKNIDDDKKQYKVSSPGSTILMGIDVSHYQGDVDWQKAKKAGVSFAFVKATEGINFVDPLHTKNTQALTDASIPFGSYHFLRPEENGEEQAKHFLNYTGKEHFLPPVLDIETSADVKDEDIIKHAKAWLKTVEKETGCTPILYTNTDYWNQHLNKDFTAYPLWIADYVERPSPTLPNNVNNWRFWQKRPNARISGVSISVDQNFFRGTEKTLRQLQCGD